MALIDDIQRTFQPAASGTPTVQTAASPFAVGAAGGFAPFITGDLGQDPATQAYIQAFQQNVLPTIQGQLQLQGLGSGPAVADVAGRSLATALPQIQQNALQNRLTASKGFADIGSQLAIPSAQADVQNQLQAGQGLTNLGSNVVIPSGDLQLRQQAQTLQGLQSAGELTRGMNQDVFDAQREEMLRLQGLSESGTFGAFGTLSPISKTETSQSGGK